MTGDVQLWSHFADRTWDAIVIGTGMGGGTLGYALARAGKSVLFLEKGSTRPGMADSLRGDYLEALVDIGLASEAERQRALGSGGRYREELHDAASQGRFLPFLGSGTGGSSALYGMACERFFPADFTPRRNFSNVGDSTVPECWPVRYDEMLPWYAAAEQLYRVRGTRDPFRPADENEALLSPPEMTAGNAELANSLRSRGMHPYALHLACEAPPECRNCQGYLCPQPCKNDAGRVCVAPALAQHGAELLTDCHVRRLEARRSAVERVVAEGPHGTYAFAGKVVVLAAGALATPALLLRSRSADWPQGLANSSGLAGRNLMRHAIDLYFVTPEVEPSPGQIKELAFNDFYHTDGLKLGAVQSFGPAPPVEQIVHATRGAAGRSLRLLKPLLRWAWRRWMTSKLALAAIMEDLPYAENRVLPTDDGISFRYQLQANERSRLEVFRHCVAGALAGRRFFAKQGAAENKFIAHVCGTCRFGDDPRTSVLDRDNRAHELDNLYVCDSSFFPSSGGVNPSLTIAANALRVAEKLAARI